MGGRLDEGGCLLAWVLLGMGVGVEWLGEIELLFVGCYMMQGK